MMVGNQEYGEIVMIPGADQEPEDYTKMTFLHPDGSIIFTEDHKVWQPKSREEFEAWKKKSAARGMFTICPACKCLGTVKWNADTDRCYCRVCGWVEEMPGREVVAVRRKALQVGHG